MRLKVKLGDSQDLDWAQATVQERHYLHRRVDPRARPMAYIVARDGIYMGLVMAGIPHATRCRGWWGYPGLATQWQVVDLCRIWLSPAVQAGGYLAKPENVPGFIDRRGVFRPTVATWAIEQVLERIQEDRISLWPPVYPDQPYHIRLIISYHDPRYHKGFIYRVMNWKPMYQKSGRPCPGPSGKFGWCWLLPEPEWSWQDIRILQPRTMRLPLGIA